MVNSTQIYKFTSNLGGNKMKKNPSHVLVAGLYIFIFKYIRIYTHTHTRVYVGSLLGLCVAQPEDGRS